MSVYSQSISMSCLHISSACSMQSSVKLPSAAAGLPLFICPSPSFSPPLRNKVAQFVGFQLIAHIFWAYFVVCVCVCVSNKFHRSFVFVFHFHFHLHISITKIDGKVSDGAQAQLTSLHFGVVFFCVCFSFSFVFGFL